MMTAPQMTAMLSTSDFMTAFSNAVESANLTTEQQDELASTITKLDMDKKFIDDMWKKLYADKAVYAMCYGACYIHLNINIGDDYAKGRTIALIDTGAAINIIPENTVKEHGGKDTLIPK